MKDLERCMKITPETMRDVLLCRPLLGGLQQPFTPGGKSAHNPQSESQASQDTNEGHQEAHSLKDEVRCKYLPQHEVSAQDECC